MARKKISRILSGGVIVACTVLLCTLNVSAQFQAVEVTHTVSGNAGVPGVIMQGLPGNPTTDESGYYIVVVKWGWSGTVTPRKNGYTFEPSSKTYPEITGDQDNQDYQATPVTYTISGSVGVPGVQMTGLPDNPVTGSDGKYSTTVEYGWNGTVVPTKDGLEFSPSERSYRNIGADMPRQDYSAKEIKITISGTTREAGVEMQGFPSKVVTDSMGSYTTTVEWGWSGTVTPVKQGYTFLPEETPYTNLTFNQTNQDYAATPITYTISGMAERANVEMKGFPDTVYTDAGGYYSAVVKWGWSGVVTPQLDGYTFKPASMTYSNVDSDRDNQSYTATMKTFVISGSAGQEGVQMVGLPSDPITGPGGAYSVTVDWNWSGTVEPFKEGYEFTPSNKLYPPVTMDMKNQNYTASLKQLTISGTVGDIRGVSMQGAPGRPVLSGSGGSYSISVPWGWNGTITPQKEGYEFDPPSIQYTDVRFDEVSRNYNAALLKRVISGTIISDKGDPVDGVLLMSDLGLTTSTDSSGMYSLEVDHGWSGMVTPTSEGHTFRPPAQRYNNVGRDMPNQNFKAIVKMFKITDKVSMNGVPIRDVKITATDIPGSTATDAQGDFTIRVPYNWTGEVVPTKPGINFNPPSKSYSTPITQNMNMGIPEPTITTTPRPSTTTRRPTTTTTSQGAGTTLPQTLPATSADGTLPSALPPTGEGIQPATTAAETGQSDMDPDLKKIYDELQKLKEQREPTIPKGVEYDPATVPVSNTFAGEELSYVLENLGTQAKFPVIPEASVYGEVYCTLDEVPLDAALQIVLAGTPYVYKKTPHYYLVSPGDPNNPMFSIMSETRPVNLDYVKANAAIALLSNAFLPYVKADPDPNSHTILVTAPSALMDRIISDLEQVDKTPKPVMLDARIVIMERGDLLNMGIEWGWPTIRAGMFSNELIGDGGGDLVDFGGKWPWGVQMGYSPDATFTDSLVMALNLLVENDEAKILSKPQLMALDGRQAKIQVLKEEYFLLTPTTYSATYGYATSFMENVTSGTTLTITPYVGDDEDITLEMAVEVSDSIPSARSTDLPVITRRTAENTVRIKDGGTAIVAGLTENRSNHDYKRVPGFSKLPLIGSLFKNTDNEDTSREIAVFITARIVPDDDMNVEFTGPSPTSMIQNQQPQTPQYQIPIEQQPVGSNYQSSLLDAISRQGR